MEDREILALLFARSEQAITALSSKFGRRLQRLAGNILPTAQDVEEAVNDTYLAVWNTVPPHNPDPITPYILRICKNISVSRLRILTAQKRSAYEVALDELSETVGRNTLERIIEARVLGRVIDGFLDTVSQVDRVIFLRRYWYGDRVKDIARRMGMTENAVSVRLNRLRSSLRHILVKEGYYES